jgi:2,5-furandicarboxylate decarboxylase 1
MGELKRVTREVEPRKELAGVMSKIENLRHAYLFEHVAGSKYPVIGGLYSKLERFGMALGHDFSTPFTHEEFDARIEIATANPLSPVLTANGPVKEFVMTGDAINLAGLPVPTFFELDSGPFITGAIGISRDPESGVQNIGIYRTLILDRNRLVITANSFSDLRRIYDNWEKRGEPMPIALALGVAPAMQVAAVCKLAPDHCEYDIAGGLLGAPIELVQCQDSDLLVPANAEFIIEGTVDFSNRVTNLLGEFADHYGPDTAPAATVNTITHRKDPLFYSILPGRNPEHNTLGHVAVYGFHRKMIAALKEVIPEIKDISVNSNPGMGTLAHITISIDKKSDAQPREIIEKAFATSAGAFPISRITRRVIVVDDDINVHDFSDVQWAIWTRVARAPKFMVIPDVESWVLDRAAKEGMKSVRIGIDATMDLEDVDKLVRPVIPGADNIVLEEYLAKV